MDGQKNYGGLDRFRMIAAVLVVAIHTSPLASFSADADFFLTRVLARIAVPFFFMVTGQFVLADCLEWREDGAAAGNYGARNKSGMKAVKPGTTTGVCAGKVQRYIKKIAVLYGASILLYIPIGIYAGHYKGLGAPAAFRMLVFDGTFYHLWYFPACIMGVAIVYALSRFLSIRGVTAAAGILYVIGLFGDSYFGLIQDLPVISDIYKFGFRIFSYTRNGIFFTPVFLVLGAIAGKRNLMEDRRKNIWFCSGGLVISFLLMTAEAFTLRYFEVQRHDSMYIMLIPVMVFLYELLLAWNQKPSKALRTISLWIYILHPAMIIVVRGAAKVLHMEKIMVGNSLIHYAAVLALAAAASVGMRKNLVSDYKKNDNFPRGRAWIELDREALQHNVETLRSRLPGNCRLMPAVKADAYGHGAVLVAKELNRMGIDAFCVASASEGVELRRQGIEGEILVLGYTHPRQFPLLWQYHLIQTVIDYSYAVQLNGLGRRIHVHIGIDTGMHRLGERSENTDRICRIFEMENLEVDGIFTHLSAADTMQPREREFTGMQAKEFYKVIDELEKRGYHCPKIHMQSSYGVLNYPKLAGDYARVGIALYGVLSTGEDTEQWKNFLRPVLSLKTRVAAVKDLYAGETAGYGLAFAADHDMKIAALAIGYADGVPRALSNGVGEVLIGGCRAPIVGRICMDQMLVDVSHIPGVKAGDEAVLIGKSGKESISAADLAEWTGTITNEILSRLGARLERMVV